MLAGMPQAANGEARMFVEEAKHLQKDATKVWLAGIFKPDAVKEV